MENRHRKYPSVMAELFGNMPLGNAFFVVRRLDMRGMKAEMPTQNMRTGIHGFLFVTHGEALLEIGGRSCYLRSDECTVVPAGQSFSVRYFNDCSGYMGGFNTEYIGASVDGMNIMQSFSILRRWDVDKVCFGRERSGFIASVMERLCAETGTGNNRNIVRAYLMAFLTEIEEAFTSTLGGGDAFRTDNEICNKYIELVFRLHDYSKPLSEYAEKLHISKDYLHKIVKRFTGKTPLEWISEAVLLEARTLLRYTSKPVSEVAYAVGVTDPSYFARLFRKQTGLSPLEYRKGRKC